MQISQHDKTIDAGTAPPKGAIWDKSSEQHHAALNKDNFNAQLVIFDEYKVIWLGYC